MRSKSFIIVPVCLAFVVAMQLMQRSSIGADANDSADQRIAALEKLVAKNPAQPGATIVERVEALERSLKMEGAPADVKTVDDLKQALIRSDVRQQALARRLSEVETRNTGAGGATPDKAVGELKKAVDAQERDVKDIGDRVRRLESRGLGR